MDFNLDNATRWVQGLQAMGGPVTGKALSALLILVLAWLVARLVRGLVQRAGQARGLDAKVSSPGLSALLADIAYWLVWLLALPALLGALQLDGLLAPVQAMVTRMLGFLPNLLGAAVVFGIGLLGATIVRRLLSGTLTAAGSERLAKRLGLDSALGPEGLAGLVAKLAFFVLLLPVVAAALQPLGLDAVTQPISRLVDTVMALIPRLLAAGLLLVVFAFGGRILASMVTATLAASGFNRLPGKLGLPDVRRAGERTPAEWAGNAVMLAVMLLAVTQASEMIGFGVITATITTVSEVLARLFSAVVVALVGVWLAQAAATAIRNGSGLHAVLWSQIARVAVLVFTAALALRQAGLPAEIIAIAFAGVVGGLSLGMALAIGLGGRHLAARLLSQLAAALGARDTTPAPPAQHD